MSGLFIEASIEVFDGLCGNARSIVTNQASEYARATAYNCLTYSELKFSVWDQVNVFTRLRLLEVLERNS